MTGSPLIAVRKVSLFLQPLGPHIGTITSIVMMPEMRRSTPISSKDGLTPEDNGNKTVTVLVRTRDEW